LLLQVNGDVRTALKIMNQLKKLGYLPRDTDLDEFAGSSKKRKSSPRQERRQSDP